MYVIKGIKIKSKIIKKQYTVDSAKQFHRKSILRPKVFSKTIRQRGS